MNRKALFGWIAAVLVIGSLTAVPATVAHAAGSTVVISPPSLVFNLASYRSTSLAQTVTVRNTGSSTVTFQRNHIGGNNPSEFSKQSDGCSFVTLNVGQSCQVAVAFVPRAYPVGARTAILSFVDDATTTGQTVNLSGTSVIDPPVRQDIVYSNLPCCSVSNTKVQSISRGPGTDTNMWLTEVGQARIGSIPLAGGNVNNIFAGAGSKPYGLAVAPSDASDIFFTDQNGNGRLAKMNVSTQVVSTMVAFPSPTSNPGNLTVGPDGNLWGVEMGAANRIFRYTLPSGPLDEYSTGLPANSGLNSIAQGPSADTNLYFTMASAGKLGKISTGATPTITILPTILTNTWLPSGIVAGPDGHMWVTLAGVSHVIQVNTDGTGLVLHPLPTSNAHPVGIAADALGNLYVTGAGKLSKVHFASNVFSYIADVPMPANFTQAMAGLGWGAVATDGSNNAWFSQWNTYSPTDINGHLYEYVVTGAPTAAISPGLPTVQFGNQADNTYSGDYTAYLYNSGTNDFHVTATTFGGADAAFFHLTMNGCLGQAVTPNMSCQFSVDFSPNAVRAYAANLTFMLTNAFGGAIPSQVQNLAGTGTAQAAMSQFPVHGTAFGPYCQGFCSSSNLIANGPSSIIFAEPNINRVGMMTTAGVLSQWVLPTSGAAPLSVAWDQGSPGKLWFTESSAGQIGRLDLSTHVITEFPIPTSDAMPVSIVFDPGNGLMYFTASGSEGAFIDTINSSGVITEFLKPFAFSPGRVIVGGDNNIWAETSGQLLRMTPTGTFLTSPGTIGPIGSGLANGPMVSGQPTIWYSSGPIVSYLTTDGTTAQGTFNEPISLGAIQGLTQGTGNTMYFTIGGGMYGGGDANKIAKVVVTGTTIGGFSDESIIHEDSSPTGITLGPDGNLWFLEQNPGSLGRAGTF